MSKHFLIDSIKTDAVIYLSKDQLRSDRSDAAVRKQRKSFFNLLVLIRYKQRRLSFNIIYLLLCYLF